MLFIYPIMYTQYMTFHFQAITILGRGRDPRRLTRELYRGVRLQGAATWLQPSDLECVLCYHTYTRPVTTPCGHNYCRTCIERCMDYKKSCALCLRSLDDFNLSMVSFVYRQQKRRLTIVHKTQRKNTSIVNSVYYFDSFIFYLTYALERNFTTNFMYTLFFVLIQFKNVPYKFVFYIEQQFCSNSGVRCPTSSSGENCHKSLDLVKILVSIRFCHQRI